MKKIRFILIAIAILMSPAISYAQWIPLNSGTTMDLQDIFFKDASTGFCVGEKGIILKTTDGGLHWDKVYEDTTLLYLNNIISTENKITVFGNINSISKAYMLQSSDNGLTWAGDTVNFYPMLATRSVKNVDNQLFVLTTEGTIEKYDSAQWQSIPGNEIGLIFDVNSQGIYLAKNSDFIKSTDGGANWQTIQMSSPHMPGGSQYTMSNMRVFNDTIILALTYGSTTVFSFDGGATWNDYQLPTTPYNCFISSPNVITGMNGGTIVRTIDGGQTFINQDTLPNAISTFYFVNENLGFVCGQNGMIYKTTNGGGLPTGIGENKSLKKKLKVFPNPAKNNIRLQYDNLHIQSLQLTDLSGRIIKTFPPESKILDVSGVAAGMYFLKVKAKEGEMVEKVLLK